MSTAPTNPPHPLIVRELRKKQVIPFLGAGVNFGTRPLNEEWKLGSEFLPSGKELSFYLAMLTNLIPEDKRDIEDLAKVASYYVDVSGVRDTLRADLREIFVREFAPTKIHTYLAQEALYYVDGKSPYEKTEGQRETRGTPLLIVTTNYDDLTEKAFQMLGRPYDLVIYPTDRADVADSVLWRKAGHDKEIAVPPNSLRIELEKTNVIYKMHGSIDRSKPDMDSFVITEEDYVDFLARMAAHGAIPMQFVRYFRSRRFLFLGYGLNDWNLRVVLRNLRTVLPTMDDQASQTTQPLTDDAGRGAPDSGRQPSAARDANLQSWAIQYRPSMLEAALWDARKVRIYDQNINDFAMQLAAFANSLDAREAGN